MPLGTPLLFCVPPSLHRTFGAHRDYGTNHLKTAAIAVLLPGRSTLSRESPSGFLLFSPPPYNFPPCCPGPGWGPSALRRPAIILLGFVCESYPNCGQDPRSRPRRLADVLFGLWITLLLALKDLQLADHAPRSLSWWVSVSHVCALGAWFMSKIIRKLPNDLLLHRRLEGRLVKAVDGIWLSTDEGRGFCLQRYSLPPPENGLAAVALPSFLSRLPVK